MEDEGIMALPQGQEAMQNQDLPAITSMDSYDAATTALGRVNPEQLTAYKQAIREAIAGLQLSPAEIETLLEIVEYMSQNPAEYPKLLRQLIDQDYIDEGDLPEQFDPVYLGVMLAALNELKLSVSEGATAPMQMAPEVEGLGPMPMAEGGLADMARLLAAQGRNGDTMLAHITPEEARLLKSRGGSGSINPQTGLPEFFLGKLFKGIKKVFKAVGSAVKSALKNPIVRIIASVALATVLGPTGFAVMSAPAAAATASAATTLGAGGSLKEALISSATSYFGAGGGIGGFKPGEFVATKVGQYVPGGATGAIAKGIGSGVTGTGIGLLAGMKPEEALRMGAIQGLTTGATEAFQNWRAGQPRVSQPVNRAIGELPPEDYVAPTAEAGGYGTVYPDQYSPTEGAAAPTTGAPAAPAATTAPAATQVAGAGGAPVVGTAAQTVPGKTFTERLGQFVNKPGLGTFTDAFLVNPNETQNYLARYAPTALTTMGIGALTGGFKPEPVNESPLFNRQFTGLDYIRQNPGMFSGSLGRIEGMPAEYNPVVPTPSYARLPTTTPSVVIPRGATLSPAGIVQPYNVAGLYGVPDLAAPVPQPVYMADGGSIGLPTRQQRIDTMIGQFMQDNPGMTADQLRPMVEQRVDAINAQNQGYYSTGTSAAPAQSTVNTANFAQPVTTPAPYNPAVPSMPERTAVRRPRAQMLAPVQELKPRIGIPMMPRYNQRGLYGMPDLAQPMNKGGTPTHFPRKTGPIDGPGTGTSDSIPAMLSDGEFVFTAKAVRNAGGGSRRKGAKRMYALMKKLEGGPVKGNA